MPTLGSSPKLLLIGAIAAASSAQAEQFSWQLSGVTSRSQAGDFKRDNWAVAATYYLNPVDDSAGPYALASFLNPTTRVSAEASQSDSALAAIDDPTAYTLSGAYVLPSERWYVGANYAKADGVDMPPVSQSDPKGYGILAGRYLGASTTLELGLGRSEQSLETSLACPFGAQVCIAVPFSVETTTDSVNLEVFHVRRFRSLTYSLQGSVSHSQAEVDVSQPMTPFDTLGSDGPSLDVYSFAGELFPTDRLGVRFDYSRPDVEGADRYSYGVAATWFFKPRIAMQVSLSRVSIDAAAPGFDEPESAAIRFIGRL
jgi:hypothetical protein